MKSFKEGKLVLWMLKTTKRKGLVNLHYLGRVFLKYKKV
jgi:hypothetical protein